MDRCKRHRPTTAPDAPNSSADASSSGLQQQQSRCHNAPPPTLQQQQQQPPQLRDLPEALVTQIVLAGGTQRHLHGVLASVCQDWRRCLLQNTRQLSVGLTSTSGAASLKCWLQAHAAALQQLHMATVGLFGRNCDPEARLRLFQALHPAAAGPGAPDDSAVPEPRPAGGAAGGSSSSRQDDLGSPGDGGGSSSSSQHSGGGRSSSRQPSSGGSQEGGGLGGADSEAAGSSDSDADTSKEEGWTDSPVRTPAVGGLFGGCSHLATPSPSGGLIAAAAAAAAAATAGATAVGVAAAAAGPLREAQPTGFGYLHNEQPLQQQQQPQQQQPSQQGTPSKRSTPRKQLHQQQRHQLLVQPQQQQEQQEQQEQQQVPQQLQLQQLSANMRLTPADCAAIASLPAPQLCSLWLQGSRTRRLAIDGVRCLAGMTQLTSLKLQQFSIGDDATVLLAKSLSRLQLLFLSGNNIGPAGAAAVAQHCTRLEHLDLSINRVNAAALASVCGTLHRLRDLNLAGNSQLDAAALQHLQQLTLLSGLTVSSSSLNNQDLSAICSALPQLRHLDAGNNRITKADPLTALVSLTSLVLSRNSLQLNCSKVLAGMPLQSLVLFSAAPARATSHLSGGALTQQLTSLTLGADPSLFPEGTDESLQLAKTRTVGALFGVLAEAGRLRVLSVPCTGLGDAQAKLLHKLGSSLQTLNVSYNCLSPAGLKVLRELPRLERLELRAMRPELTDGAIANISSCTRLTHLDLAHNDVSSVGVKQLGTPALGQLQHLDLRNNAQVEKWAVLSAAPHLSRLTGLNLMEISDVRARAFPRAAAAGRRGAASGHQAAAAAGATPGSTGRQAAAVAAAAAGGGGGSAAGLAAGAGGVRRPHADIWAALPDLEELWVEAENGFASRGSRGGRVVLSTL